MIAISATGHAFAALKSDGTVVAWGWLNDSTVPTGLSGVTKIYSSGGAFAALKNDGTVVAWGKYSNGGMAPYGLSGITQIYSNEYAFAALTADGSVVAWGEGIYGGSANWPDGYCSDLLYPKSLRSAQDRWNSCGLGGSIFRRTCTARFE